jgi:hypothetical protein
VEIAGHVYDANRARNKYDSHRLAAGQKLVELRGLVEASGDDWWKWWDGNQDRFLLRSRKDCEKLIKLASAENPEQAFEQERERVRVAVAKSREKKAVEVTVTSSLDVGRCGHECCTQNYVGEPPNDWAWLATPCGTVTTAYCPDHKAPFVQAMEQRSSESKSKRKRPQTEEEIAEAIADYEKEVGPYATCSYQVNKDVPSEDDEDQEAALAAARRRGILHMCDGPCRQRSTITSRTSRPRKSTRN